MSALYEAIGYEAAFVPVVCDVAAVCDQMQEYRRLLAAHDWLYEFADDARAYRAGLAEREALRVLQERIDPERVVWRQYSQGSF